MRIFLDPWNPEYSPSIQADAPDSTPAEIRLDVESAEWKPIQPPLSPPVRFTFIDGVRRVEARIILQNGKILYGLLGSIAAGAVQTDQKSFRIFDDVLKNKIIERYFITCGGTLFEMPVSVHEGIQFTPISVPDESIQAPLQKLQQLMRDAEGKLISQMASKNPETVIVADGPLHFPWAKQSQALGYVKSFHEWYLPPPQVEGLATLPVGFRTPLFLIQGSSASFPDRFGWFVRLSAPDAGDSPLSGLARLEVSSEGGLEKAKLLANHACDLPRFVSKKYQDPRSPQNLLPIGALEKTLKHFLGDVGLLQRWIQVWIQRQSLS